MQRKFLLTGFTLKPDGTGGTAATTSTSTTNGLTLGLTGQVFLSPIVAATTPTTPVAAPATTPAP